MGKDQTPKAEKEETIPMKLLKEFQDIATDFFESIQELPGDTLKGLKDSYAVIKDCANKLGTATKNTMIKIYESKAMKEIIKFGKTAIEKVKSLGPKMKEFFKKSVESAKDYLKSNNKVHPSTERS